MKFALSSIPDILLVEPTVHGDDRGFFMETYQIRRFTAAGIPHTFLQDNHSGSIQGTLRGLHYQTRQVQGKLIRVIVGEVFDVAVDLRLQSPTFGQWAGARLSAENKIQVWIPPGFAHGFYVLSDWAEVVYKVTDLYAPEWEHTLLWNEPEIGIAWPLIPGTDPIISPKDAVGKPLREAALFRGDLGKNT